MPVHVVEKLNKILRTERKLRAERGREPRRGGDRPRARPDGRRGGDQTAQRADTGLAREAGRRRRGVRVRALHHGRAAPQPEEVAEDILRKEALVKILGARPIGAAVLELRYGLNGEQPRTDEVGRFQVTRERIRQIENQSLKKLRALADSQKLRVAVRLDSAACGRAQARMDGGALGAAPAFRRSARRTPNGRTTSGALPSGSPNRCGGWAAKRSLSRPRRFRSSSAKFVRPRGDAPTASLRALRRAAGRAGRRVGDRSVRARTPGRLALRAGVADDKGQLWALPGDGGASCRGELPVNVRFVCDGEEETRHQVVEFIASTSVEPMRR